MELKLQKGCLILLISREFLQKVLDKYLPYISKEDQESKINRDGDDYHMTILTPADTYNKKKLENLMLNDVDKSFLTLGLGKTKTTSFLVCHYPYGDKIRKELGLGIHHFHITLGFSRKDEYNINKDITYIIQPNYEAMSQILDYKTVDRVKWLHILDRMIHLNHYNKTKYEKYEWWYYYVTAWANLQKFDKTEQYIGALVDLNPWLGHYVRLKIKNIIRSMTLEDIKLAVQEIGKIPSPLKYQKEINELLDLMNSNAGVNSKIRYSIENDKLLCLPAPRNLTRINYGDKKPELFGAGMITQSHVNFIKLFDFDMVLCLTEKPSTIQRMIYKKYCHFPINDTTPPTLEEMYKLISIIDSHKKVIIHCAGGKGRANTVILGYLMWKLNIKLYQAMKLIRERQQVITNSQQLFLKQFEKNEALINPIKSLKLNGNSPQIIMLLGLPCSGKSTFSQHLKKQCPENIIYLSQDELGRGKYLTSLQQNMTKLKPYKFILLDRCHVTKDDRSQLLNLTKKYKLKVWCLWFDISMTELLMRAKKRTNHLIISAAKAPSVIKEKAKKLEIPDIKEGFQFIVHLRDEDEVNQLLKNWKLKVLNLYDANYFKFPRTKHFFSLGSAERNDLLMSNQEQQQFFNVDLYVEEKIDGANLGISIDSETMVIKYQNRSHYITSASHQQFNKLDQWQKKYGNALYDILEPGRHILFGEWVYLRHTIPYTKLPSYFLVFDLYDKKLKKFLSRHQIEKRLEGTNIPMVPLIYEGKIKSKNDVLRLLNKISEYGNTQIEGLYFKISDTNDFIINRGKVVKSDFIADNAEFWDKHTCPNKLSF